MIMLLENPETYFNKNAIVNQLFLANGITSKDCSSITWATHTRGQPFIAIGQAACSLLGIKKLTQEVIGVPYWLPGYGCYCLPCHDPLERLFTGAHVKTKQGPDYTFYKDFVECIQRLPGISKTFVDLPDPEYVFCGSSSLAAKELDKLVSLPTMSVALDLETTGFDPRGDKIVLLGLGFMDRTLIMPNNVLQGGEVKHLLRQMFSKHLVGGHNCAKFDKKFLNVLFEDFDFRFSWDTLVSSYLFDERLGIHGLKHLAAKWFYYPDYAIDFTVVPTEKVPIEELSTYLAHDCTATLRLYRLHRLQFKSEQKMEKHYLDVVMPGVNALSDIEYEGVNLDYKYLWDMTNELDEETEEALDIFYERVEELGYTNFNINSPKQLSELLYNELKLRSRNGSTDVKDLEYMAERYPDEPTLKALINYRRLNKLKTTYFQGLSSLRNPITGMIHANFKVFGTKTGRLSCEAPNLQNLPASKGLTVKRAFKPKNEDYVLLNADYAQLELKTMAFLSGDKGFIKAFQQQEDIHSVVGEQLLKKPRNQITKAERTKVKMINFGIPYGREAISLAADPTFGGTKQAAQKFIQTFFENHPELKTWIDKQHELMFSQGFVETYFGRKRRAPLVLSANKSRVSKQGQNAPVQGTASDICLRSLTLLHQQFTKLNKEQGLMIARVWLTVHDSILVECHKKWAKTIALIIFDTMVNKNLLTEKAEFPFLVDIDIGKNYGDQEQFYPFKCGNCEHRYYGEEYFYLWDKEIITCPYCGEGFQLKE